MDYYCDICNMFIKLKSKFRHLKSVDHRKVDMHKHINLTINNPNINNTDEKFYSHNNEYNIKYEYYLVRCEYILCFFNMKDRGIASGMSTDNTTMVSWKVFVENAINKLRDEGFDFSHISQMNFIIVCNKMDMTFDFYFKQIMPAVEWKINQVINKDKNLINKFPTSWIHPLNRKFKNYRF